MDKLSRKTTWFLIFLITIAAQISSTIEESQQTDHKQEEKPPLTEVLRRTISMLKNSHRSSWEKIKTAMHEIQFRYLPPNLEGSESDEENHMHGAGEKVKMAVGESFKTSTETFKGSAKSAARAVGKTVHKTKKETKTTESEGNSNPDEL